MAAGATSYTGHGAETVKAEELDRYRPADPPVEVSRHLQSLFDVSGPGPGVLAPDGSKLFFGWSVTGVAQIWASAGPRDFPTQLTGGEDRTSLSGITPDGRWLVVSRDRRGEENPGLYLMNPEGGPLRPIQHKPKVQTQAEAIDDESRAIYYSANDKSADAYAIYRYDIATGVSELVFAEPGLWHVSSVARDGTLLLHKDTGSLWAEIFTFSPKTKALTPIVGQGEREDWVAVFGARDGEIILRTNKFGEFRRLYSWFGGKLTPIGVEEPHDVLSFYVDRARTRLLYAVNDGGYTRARSLDAHSYTPIPVPVGEGADHVTPASTTPDGRFTTFEIDDGKGPRRSVVLEWAKGTTVAWTRPSTPEIDATTFARASLEFYPARDGAKIPVLVRRPPSCASALCPVIVSFHGGPEGQALPGFNVAAQAFVDAGFVYAEPNVRGSDGFGKTWIAADDGPKRLDVITDIEDAAHWARKAFSVGGKEPKVGVYGGSYGGYSVLMAMTMFAGAYDAGVDIVGISDLRTFLRNTAPYRRPLRISEYGDPDKDADALRKLSPMTYLDRVKAPLFIQQGATDPRVPAGEAIQMHEALKRRGIPSELAVFPDEGHGASKRVNRVKMLGNSIAFFQRTLQNP